MRTLKPQLNFFELGKTRDISGRIPKLPPDARDDSFQTRSMLGAMRIQSISQTQFNAKNEALHAQMQGVSAQSGIPFTHLQAISDDVPQDLPPEVYENARR